MSAAASPLPGAADRAPVDRVSAAAPLTLALVLYLAQLPLYAGYVTDDTCIYARFARNLAQSGQLAFNPGEPVLAATSPLWAALGALAARCGMDPLQALQMLGRLAGVGAIACLAVVGARRLPHRGWALLLAAVAATEPWLLRWSASGLETALGALLVAVSMVAALCPVSRVRWRMLGWSMGIGPLVRPELALLAGLVGVAVVRDRAARRRVGFWIGLVAPMAAWAAFALPQFGHLWPQTVQAKSTPLGLEPLRLLGNVVVLVKLIGAAAVLPAAAVCLGALRAIRGRWSAARPRPQPLFADRPWLLPALWVWLVALPVVYLLRDVQVISRYLEVILPVILVLGTEVVAALARGWTVAGRRLAMGAWAAQAATAVVLTAFVVSPSTRAFSSSLESGLGDIARWLRDQTPPQTSVAIYDIGLVGYVSDRHILDLGGLVDAGLNELRDQVDDRQIVEQGLFLRYGAPDYLVDWSDRPNALEGVIWGAVRPVPILTRTVANRGVSRPGPVHYTLYRLQPAR